MIVILASILSVSAQAAAANGRQRPTEDEIRTIKFEYPWIFEDSEVQSLPEEPLVELLLFYKEHAHQEPIENSQDPRHPYYINKPDYVTFVNFSYDSTTHRMYVFDMHQNNKGTKRVMSYFVSHGRSSTDPSNSRKARIFSNTKDSNMSSLGMYLTDREIWSNNLHGTAVRMHGLDKTNDNAFARMIEIHGAGYVNERANPVGRSEGCFAIDKKFIHAIDRTDENNIDKNEDMYNIIEKLVGGSLLYAWIDPSLLTK
jgi:hypothetical protein